MHIRRTILAATLAVLAAITVAVGSAPVAKAADAGQKICVSPASEVPVETANRYRIQPGKCIIIGTSSKIVVLGRSYRSRLDTVSKYGVCETGYVWINPPGSYKTWFRGYQMIGCHISA